MSGWDGIDEFVAVARTSSFARAATSLGVSKSHMSRAIADLELRLQAQLFHRTTRSVVLTPTGAAFVEHCERMIRERDDAIALVSESGEPRGQLHITCSTALGERFIAPIARRFASDYPALKIELDLSNRVLDILSEGYDLAIRTGRLLDSQLVATKLSSRKLHTCASPRYIEARGRPNRIEDLDHHDCLVGTSPLWHYQQSGTERLYRPASRWQCNNGQVILQAAIEDMGICQLPDFYMREHLQSGKLVSLLDAFAPADEPIWAAYPDRRHLSPKVKNFVQRLKQELPRALAGQATSDSEADAHSA